MANRRHDPEALQQHGQVQNRASSLRIQFSQELAIALIDAILYGMLRQEVLNSTHSERLGKLAFKVKISRFGQHTETHVDSFQFTTAAKCDFASSQVRKARYA